MNRNDQAPFSQPHRGQVQQGGQQEGSAEPVRFDNPEAFDDAYEAERENELNEEEARTQRAHDDPR